MVLKTKAKMLNDGQDDVERPENWLSTTTNAPIKIEVDDLNIFYGNARILHDVNIAIPESAVTVFVGPSGSGKTTFFRICPGMLERKKRKSLTFQRWEGVHCLGEGGKRNAYVPTTII